MDPVGAVVDGLAPQFMPAQPPAPPRRARPRHNPALRPDAPLLAGALLAASLGGGCASRQLQAQALVQTVRYQLDLELEASTTWRYLTAEELRGGPLVATPGVASPARLAGEPPPAEPPAAEPLLEEPLSEEPLSEESALQPALAPLSRFGARYALELELHLARRFRDGSTGFLARVVGAQVTPLAPPEGQTGDAPSDELLPLAPLVSWELTGRTFELRAFPDGEVLSVDGGLHLAGPDRLGGVVDLLAPLLSPFPPELDPGDQGLRDLRWPWSAASDRSWRHVLGAQWENLGRGHPAGGEGSAAAGEAAGGDLPWHLRWQGPLQSKGRDGAASPPIGVLVTGQGSGEVWLDDAPRLPVALRVQGHDLSLQRQLEVEYPSALGGPLRLRQDQQLRATLRRLPAPTPSVEGLATAPVEGLAAAPTGAPSLEELNQRVPDPTVDALPVVRYPTTAQLAASVAGLDPALAACGQGQPDGAWPFTLALAGDGRVLEPRLEGAPPAVQACVTAAMDAVRVAGHDEVPLPVRTTLVSRQGTLRTGPAVDVDQRWVSLLFVATPVQLDGAAREALHRGLGLPAPGADEQTR